MDDFSESVVNPAFGSREKVSLFGTDQIVSWAKVKDQCTNDRLVELTDTAGQVWSIRLADDWDESEWKTVLGRVADLKSAYKQLASNPKHASLAVIALRNPFTRKTALFRTLSLMFGQTAAVYAFLRFSRAIASLAARLLSLIIVEFFDDFTQLESARLAESAQSSLEELIELIGWDLARTDEKRVPFASSFVALGVKINLSSVANGLVKLSNKPGRVDALHEQIEAAARAGSLPFKEALSIRGKLAFAEGQNYGRIAAPVAQQLSRWTKEAGAQRITSELLSGLRWVVSELAKDLPRVIGQPRCALPHLVFTDGACEPEGTSIGGVLITPGGKIECFGMFVPPALVDLWKKRPDQDQVIGQAEIFPALVARWTWADELANNRVLYFIDNESARLALVKAYSPVVPSLNLVMKCLAIDFEISSAPWYARVPTFSNISDAPSRMVLSPELRSLGAKVVYPHLPDCWASRFGFKWGSVRLLRP